VLIVRIRIQDVEEEQPFSLRYGVEVSFLLNTYFPWTTLLTIRSTALEWPTLTTQWFPDKKDVKERNCEIHRLLIGTHTAEGKPNYLQIADVELPRISPPQTHHYDEDRGEIGGYGHKGNASEPPVIKFNITQKIDHPGEVNKARYQPQNPDIIATLAVDGRVLIFDRTKHSSNPTGTPNPQVELIGHKEEGFGLHWNPHHAGRLATGSEDKTVLLWCVAAFSGLDDRKMLTGSRDMNSLKDGSKTLTPERRYTHHKQVVNDVQHHPLHDFWIGSVSDDMTFQMIDVRKPETDRAVKVAEGGHTDAINALAFHPEEEVLVFTASTDKTIGVWDLRNLKTKIHTLVGHVDSVTSLAFQPNDTILGSAGYDRRVLLWDLSKIGDEQSPEDQEDGPPELLFMHGGHTNHLADFSWNPNRSWTICSAAEDNLLQIWKPADSITSLDDVPMPMKELDGGHGSN
jgi:histone-binding protein RBBP4